MGSVAVSEQHGRLPTRVCGAMMLAGGVLGVISVLMPPRAANSDAVVLVLAAIAIVFGGLLLRSRYTLPEWLLGVAVASGTVLVTLATYEGGTLNTGTDDNEMLYVWICLLAFNFLSLRHAAAQLALVAIAYAVLLTDTPFGEAATRWVISMTTLAVAGLAVYRLRSSRDRLIAELTERARTDGLTGLLNRTALEERAILELARARRDGMPLSLVVIDLDDFKEHNDSRGHPAGDEALRSVANGLRRETRQIDALARLGGDEFGVLLPGTPAAQALVVANRLRDLAWADNDVLMTLSIGVATSDEVSDFERLWNAADAAMYEAKRSGGDAVRTTPPGSAGNQLRGAAAG